MKWNMKRDLDLLSWLKDWPYDPDKNIRLLRCPDGREVIQVRQPVGIEQYELDGRPDGTRPHDTESLLDYHVARFHQAKEEGKADSFALSEEECAELFNEGVLYYFRYFYLFQLEEWELTIRDTTRNLQLFDFVHRYAARDEDRSHLEQWRPYIIRMHAVARAMLSLDEHHHATARDALQQAITQLEQLEPMESQTFHFELDRSLAALREMLDEVESNRPLTERERLERALQAAVDEEQFERAAELRDKLRALNHAPHP
jgi:hypothetical protein